MKKNKKQALRMGKAAKELDRFFELIQKEPGKRLFFIGRECYIIFSGSNWDNLNPFIRIGNSSYLSRVKPEFGFIIVSDSFSGNVFLENQNFEEEEARIQSLPNLGLAKIRTGDGENEELRNQYVGNEEQIQSLLNFLGKPGAHYLTPSRSKKGTSGGDLKLLSKKKRHARGVEEEKYLASYFDNGNVRIYYHNISRERDNFLLFDLFSRIQGDLNIRKEIDLFLDLVKGFPYLSARNGLVDEDGQLLVHNMGYHFIINPSKKNSLLWPIKWGFSPDYLQGILLGKQDSAISDNIKVYSFNLFKLLGERPLFIISENKAIRAISDLFERQNHLVKVFDKLNFDFSPGYQALADCDRNYFSISTNGNVTEMEIHSDSGNLKTGANKVILPNLPRKFQKQAHRQALFIREDYPDKFFNPAIYYLPRNSRCEFRLIHKAQDLGQVNLELSELFDLVDEGQISSQVSDLFKTELEETIKRLLDSNFHYFDSQLRPISFSRKDFKKNSWLKDPWAKLLEFNQHYIRWQLSGKNKLFEAGKYLREMKREGYFYTGYCFQFQDNQFLMVYLPELNPMRYLSGMENPLRWEEQDILEAKVFENFRDKIIEKDEIFFLDIFANRLRNVPLKKGIKDEWKSKYKGWITFYINDYSRMITDRKRLERLIALLEPVRGITSEEELHQILKENDADIILDEGGAREKDKTDRIPAQRVGPLLPKVFFGGFAIAILMMIIFFLPGIKKRIQESFISSPIEANETKSESGKTGETGGDKKFEKMNRKEKLRVVIEKEKTKARKKTAVNKMLSQLMKGNNYMSDIYKKLHQAYPRANEIYSYLNRFAILNGYKSLDGTGAFQRRAARRLKNPHWIYPGNILKRPDGSLWHVKKGESFWIISTHELREKLDEMLSNLFLADTILLKVAEAMAVDLAIFQLNTVSGTRVPSAGELAGKAKEYRSKSFKPQTQDLAPFLAALYRSGFIKRDPEQFSSDIIQESISLARSFTGRARQLSENREHKFFVNKRKSALDYLSSLKTGDY